MDEIFKIGDNFLDEHQKKIVLDKGEKYEKNMAKRIFPKGRGF